MINEYIILKMFGIQPKEPIQYYLANIKEW